MAHRFSRRIGDSDPLIELALEDHRRQVPDLTSAQLIELHLRAPAGGANLIVPMLALGDPTLGIVQEDPASPVTPTIAGVHRGYVFARLADGTEWSFPNRDDLARLIELDVAPR